MKEVSDEIAALEAIRRDLSAHGLILRGGFHPRAGDDAPSGAATVLLVGNAGPAMWRAFEAARAPGPDPLNAWTRRVLEPVAARHGAVAHYPFEGPPYAPFIAWARRAEPVHASPLGMLIHPVHGLWHAWRGALAFPGKLALPPREDAPNPCDSCAERPCLSACPVAAFSGGDYDVAACAAHLRGAAGADCMAQGCRARRACPIGVGYVYQPDQAALHMAAFLRGQPADNLCIRAYEKGDAAAITRLFYETVHTVNAADYTPEQRHAWAPAVPDPDLWHARLAAGCALVAEKDGAVVAFASLEDGGRIDLFFCRADSVRRGIGARLYRHLEDRARGQDLRRLFTEASITARPFFERQGFRVVTRQTVSRRGVDLTNFVMEKRLES